MSKIPEKPEDIFEEFLSDYKKLFGEDLVSVILFGSAARGEYILKKSDINFLVILSDNGIERFYEALELVNRWKKRNVSTPLFLTEKYINESLDSFPIEFLNIKSHYNLIFGKDLFENMEFKRDDLRLQLEQEMKGKLLNLRQAYFQAAGNARMASMLIHDSFGTFLSLFPAILFLKNDSISGNSTENINRVSLLFKLDKGVLDRLYNVKQGKEKINKSASIDLLKSYISQIRSLANQIDSL